MATKFTKQKIDFDVYEKANPESQVNWADQAGKLTKVVEGIRDERQGRKDAIEKSFQDQQTALNDIGEYDNVTMQQMVMNGAQDGANKSVDFNNLVKRGLAKPSEYKMFLHNQKTGFDLLKKNATNFDVSFKEYSERTTKDLNAPQEIWMAKQLEGFANINNLQVQTDPETGNVVQLRVDPVTGEPLTGESMSVQHMTLLMKQRVDKFDVNTATDNISKSIGDIITAGIRSNGIKTEITTEMRSRAEIEFFATKDGQKTLTLKAQQMIDNPQDQAAMLVSNTPGPNGEMNYYKIGSQEDFDNYDGDEASNPIVVMEFGADNLYTPKFTESQDKAALEYAKTNITAKLNVEQTADVKKIEKNVQPQPNQATLNAGKEDDAKSSKLGDYITMLTDKDPVKREAIEKTLRTTRNDAIDAFNAKVSNDEDKLPKISNISKGTETKRPATEKDVTEALALDPESTLKAGDEVTDINNRKITLSDGKIIEIQGSFTEQVRILEALYDPNNQLTSDDIEKLAKGRGFDLKTEITSREDEGKTSKAAYATPNYNKELQIGDSTITAVDYIDQEFGYGSGGNFNSSVDTTEGIAGGFEKLIKTSIDPAILEQFNKTPGMEFSIDWKGEDSNNNDIIVFNFGGMSYEIGNGDAEKNNTLLYDMNGQDLWKDLQKNLLNPAITKLNKNRTGDDGDYEL
jgi:hypothetical protein